MNMETKEKKSYLYKSTLLSRKGWTEKAITLFLPVHDKEVQNPRFKKASPSKLYNLQKVEEIEKTDKFIFFTENNKKRLNGALKAVSTKRNNIIEYVNDIEIVVPNIEKKELLSQSIVHYNFIQADWFHNKGGWKKTEKPSIAQQDNDEDFLSRITLNYLRHELTCYEEELSNIFGKVGNDKAYEILKNRINSAIVEKYSFLKSNTNEVVISRYEEG